MFAPRRRATSTQSLSPRPLTLMSTIWSGFKSRATLTAWAMACAVSKAGMIPSVRDRSSKRVQGLIVGGRHVLGPSAGMPLRVFRADTGVIQAGRDRVDGQRLPIVIL